MATILGLKLKRVRKTLGLTRSELARLAKVDAAQLFRLENAPNASPTFAVIARLAAILDVSLDELADGMNEVDRTLREGAI